MYSFRKQREIKILHNHKTTHLMLTNPEKPNDGNHQKANAFETIREIQHELKCLRQNLLLETWMPDSYPALISKTIDRLEILRENCIQALFQPGDSGLVFTAPKVYLNELGYAMKAHGSFNNGNAPVHKILSALEKMANVDLGNTSRTFQQILARKMGYTKYLDSLKLSLNERIDDFY
jgi:RteC protein